MHLRPRFLSRRMAPPEDQSVDLIGALRSQLDTQKRSAPLCEEHLITGSGTRAGCVMCGLIEESRAFSRISYLLQLPNNMEVSDYDIHCDEQLVVKRLEAFLAHVTLLDRSIVTSFRSTPA